MAQKRKPDQSKLIHAAALELAGASGWDNVTLEAVAAKAKLKLADVEALFSSPWDILLDVLKMLDAEVTADVADRLGDNWRDNLFELLMTRFDKAQEHRSAFASLPQSLLRNPCAAQKLSLHFVRMIDNMLKQAGLTSRLFMPAYVAALSALYLSLVHTWEYDDSDDMSKTMAALDKRLGYFEQLVALKR